MNFERCEQLQRKWVEFHRQKCSNDWWSHPNDGYFFENFISHHLFELKDVDEINRLLTNFHWLGAKLNSTDVFQVISDFSFSPSGHLVDAIKNALIVSVQQVSRDPSQLGSQLVGRLCGSHQPDVIRFRNSIKASMSGPWVNFLTPSLIQANKAGLIFVSRGHQELVAAVDLTTDGSRCVTGSDDHTIKVWDIHSGEELRTLRGHQGEIHAVKSSGLETVFSASSDKSIIQWDVLTGAESKTFFGHEGEVVALAVHPKRTMIASGSSDDTARLWDIESGTTIAVMTGHQSTVQCVTFTPDGKLVLTGSYDGTIKVWRVGEESCIETFHGHSSIVSGIIISKDGHEAISTSWDGTVRTWNIEHLSTPVASKLSLGSRLSRMFGGWRNQIIQNTESEPFPFRDMISVDGDQQVLLTSLLGGLSVCDRKSKIIRSTGIGDAYAIATDTESLSKVAISSSGGGVSVLDLGAVIEAVEFAGHKGYVSSIAVTKEGRFAVSCCEYESTLIVWSLETHKIVRRLTGHKENVRFVRPGSEPVTVFSCCFDNEFKVWNVETGEVLNSFNADENLHFACISSDGSAMALADTNGKLVAVNQESGVKKELVDYFIRAAMFSNDSSQLVACDERKAYAWNTETLDLEYEIFFTAQTSIISFAVIENQIIVGFRDGTIRAWEIDNGTEFLQLKAHHGSIRSVINAGGSRFVSVGDDGLLKVWELEGGVCIASIEADTGLYCCGVVPYGNIFIVGDLSGTVHFLELANGKTAVFCDE